MGPPCLLTVVGDNRAIITGAIINTYIHVRVLELISYGKLAITKGLLTHAILVYTVYYIYYVYIQRLITVAVL